MPKVFKSINDLKNKKVDPGRHPIPKWLDNFLEWLETLRKKNYPLKILRKPYLPKSQFLPRGKWDLPPAKTPETKEPLPPWAEMLWQVVHRNKRVKSLPSFVWTITVLVGGVVGQFFFMQQKVKIGLISYAIAFFCLWQLTRKQTIPPLSSFGTFPKTSHKQPVPWKSIILGFGGAILLEIGNLSLFFKLNQFLISFLIHLVAMAFLYFVIAGFDRKLSVGVHAPCFEDRSEKLLFGFMLFVTFFFMFFRFMQVPSCFSPASLEHTSKMFALTDKVAGLFSFSDATNSLPMLYEACKILPYKLTGNLFFAVRFTSAFFGLLSVIVLYCTVRRWTHWRSAFYSGLVMGTSFFFVNLSRWGYSHSFTIFMTLLVFYFLSRALQLNRRRDFVLAGLTMGFALFSGLEAFWFVLFPVIFFIYLFFTYKAMSKKDLCVGFAILFVAALVAAAPMLNNHIQRFGFHLNPKLAQIFQSHPNMGTLVIDRGKVALRMFLIEGNLSVVDDFYGAGAPLLDFVSGLLMMLGLGLAVIRFKRPLAFASVALILLFLVPLAMLDYTIFPKNFAVALPALFICIGLLLDELFLTMPGPIFFFGKLKAMVVLILLCVLVLNYRHYFVYFAGWNAIYNFQGKSGTASAMAKEMRRDAKRGQAIFANNEFEAGGIIDFMFLRQPFKYYPCSEWTSFPTAGSQLAKEKAPYHFYLYQAYEGMIPLIQHFYPNAKFIQHQGMDKLNDYFHFEVALSEIKQLHDPLFKPTGFTSVQPSGFHVSLAKPFNGSTLEWKGYMYFPLYGEYSFQGDTGGTFTIEIDGNRLTGAASRVVLSSGIHPVRVVWSSPKDILHIQWKIPGSTGFTEIPWHYLLNSGLPQNTGLQGSYYTANDRQVKLAFKRHDPGLFFTRKDFEDVKVLGGLQKEYKILWTGEIEFSKPGDYYFFVICNGGDCEIDIDHKPFMKLTRQDVLQKAYSVDKEGKVSFELHYHAKFDPKAIELFWTVPGSQVRTMIPMTSFHPRK